MNQRFIECMRDIQSETERTMIVGGANWRHKQGRHLQAEPELPVSSLVLDSADFGSGKSLANEYFDYRLVEDHIRNLQEVDVLWDGAIFVV